MKNKIIAALLLASMLLTAVACAEKADNKPADTAAVTVAGETEEEGTTALTPDLPDANYDNADFNIYYSNNAEYGGVKNDFAAEELNGEPINDARFNRNRSVEDKYGVVIQSYSADGVFHDAAAKALRTLFTAGDDTYDFIMSGGYTTCALAAEGLLYDLNEVPYLDLTKPWWDQKANDNLTVLGHMFYTTGDISTADNEATYCIMFNKNMFTDYSLPDPYTMVRDGSWTVDKYIELASGVAADVNGDGKYDSNDRYGALIWDDSMMGVVNASGEKCATVNGDGEIELTLYSDRTVTMLDKFFGFALDKTQAYTYQRYNWDDTLLGEMFKANQALFIMQLLQMVPKLRDMDADFGILPYFKFDEAQQDYFVTVGSWHSVFMAVPMVQKDVERTGIIAEEFAYEGMNTLTPAYYEITLKTKVARDEESSDMLDIIFASRVFDLGWYYQFGGYNEQVMNLLRNFKSDFASMYTKYEKVGTKAIDKINEAYANIGG